jgi:tetratricopeptide (TPR) repeat protein
MGNATNLRSISTVLRWRDSALFVGMAVSIVVAVPAQAHSKTLAAVTSPSEQATTNLQALQEQFSDLQSRLVQLQTRFTDDHPDVIKTKADIEALREKIIKLALTLRPPPATPPEADELAGRAKFIFEHANSNDDLLKAADAFKKVSLVVPWVPDYYFDAAVAYEKANDPAKALSQYKWCLLAGPDSADAKAVREKIGALSYVLEQQQAAADAEQARRNAEAQAEREREQEAERARQQAERQQQQRLARLDPLVRSLNGAVYRQDDHDRMGNRQIRTWTISGDRIKCHHEAYNGNYDANRLTRAWDEEFEIEGKTFIRQTSTPCVSTPECQLMGTISEKEIAWSWWYNGSFLNNFKDPWGGNARRVEPHGAVK